MAIGIACGVLGVLGAIPRQLLPDNLAQRRIDQDPSVACGQFGGHQDVSALDDMRLLELD